MLQIFLPPIPARACQLRTQRKRQTKQTKRVIRIAIKIFQSLSQEQPAILTLQIRCALLGCRREVVNKGLYRRFLYNDMICLKKKFRDKAFLFFWLLVRRFWCRPRQRVWCGMVWYVLVRMSLAVLDDHGLKKSSWIVVPTTERGSQVVMSMESLKLDASPKGCVRNRNQCPVFPLEVPGCPKRKLTEAS